MPHPRSKRWGFGFRASHNALGSTFYAGLAPCPSRLRSTSKA